MKGKKIPEGFVPLAKSERGYRSCGCPKCSDSHCRLHERLVDGIWSCNCCNSTFKILKEETIMIQKQAAKFFEVKIEAKTKLVKVNQ